MTSADSAAAPLVEATPAQIRDRLSEVGYVADEEIAAAVRLTIGLGRPLLIEGPPGVGKTSLARAVAEASGRRLIRLQCHEGIDAAQALYEWDYGRQLLATQLAGRGLAARDDVESGLEAMTAQLFTEEFLLERPLLAALRADEPVVLLVDELDRADDALDALLLEMLDEKQVTIPELGTVVATSEPWVFITSNETRELADAVRRRCLRIGLGYPAHEREAQIIELAVPGISTALRERVVDALAKLRGLDLEQPPGVSEGLDWAKALLLLAADELDQSTIDQTLLTIVKRNRDVGPALAALREPA